MTQEHKELLIKDLCTRLPYGNLVIDFNGIRTTLHDIKVFQLYDSDDVIEDYVCLIDIFGDNDYVAVENIKPYLFPLSSMTDELWDKEFAECGITEFTRDSFKYGCETLEFSRSNPNLSSMVKFINQLIKNHFDVYSLIPMELAIDATNFNIY